MEFALGIILGNFFVGYGYWLGKTLFCQLCIPVITDKKGGKPMWPLVPPFVKGLLAVLGTAGGWIVNEVIMRNI